VALGHAGRLVIWVALSVAGLAGVALYRWALWKIPDRMHLHNAQDRYDARLLVISVGGAIVIGAGLLYTARSYRLSHRGQITDRFTNALGHLNAEQLYVRVGGIQALGRLMHDSPIHHDDVVEVLTAFIHSRASAARGSRQAVEELTKPPTLSAQSPLPRKPPPADVQAALTALGHRPQRPERRPISLVGVCLTDADLGAANLVGADMAGADLSGVNLHGANLSGARLRGAYLKDANLANSHLTGADLSVANLTDADLATQI
jgi:Pentapeptide repeats (8 copies)